MRECVCVCVCVHPAGKRNKLRVYYLSWLRNKILHNDPEVEKKQGWTTVGDMEGCGHYRVGEEVARRWPGRVCSRERRGPGAGAGGRPPGGGASLILALSRPQ